MGMAADQGYVDVVGGTSAAVEVMFYTPFHSTSQLSLYIH
jgi:hypothetical protein